MKKAIKRSKCNIRRTIYKKLSKHRIKRQTRNSTCRVNGLCGFEVAESGAGDEGSESPVTKLSVIASFGDFNTLPLPCKLVHADVKTNT